MVKYGIAFTITEDFLKSNKTLKIVENIMKSNSKIIAAEIASRHRRSERKTEMSSTNSRCSKKYRTTYRLFIEYTPCLDKAKAIKGIKKNSGIKIR
jgi:hypothetical protein